ncbi:hypothetical protein TRVL_10175 [Trypanosoma vivax]|nr:hypothetical protein TRVL_10175 [Trypanosoma vivax]
MLTRHPRHNESLRPQPRAKTKRKEMRSEAQSQGQGEGSGPLELAGDGEVRMKMERPRKRHRFCCHTEGEKGRDFVCSRCGSVYKQLYSLVWHARPHRKHATKVKQKMKDGTVAATPLL